MVRDGWNFRNDIAIGLERIARNEYKYDDRPYNTIYDASMIEAGTFVEVMINILRKKTNANAGCADVDKFIDKSSKYFNKSGQVIDPEEADELYVFFEELYNKYSRL